MRAAQPGAGPGEGCAQCEALAGMGLNDLLEEAQDRLASVARTQERVPELLAAFLSVSSGLDLDGTLHRVVLAAAHLVGARYGALGVLAPGGGLGTFLTVGVTAEQRAAMGRPPHGDGILGQLITAPRPLRIDDLAEHPSSVGLPPGHPPMRAFLGVPITVRDVVFGNLYLTEKRGGGPFTDEDERVLVALAAAAGTAIDNAHQHRDRAELSRWQAAVGDVRAALLDGQPPEVALALVVERVASLTEADGAWLLLGPDAAGGWEVQAQSGVGLVDLSGERLWPADSPPLQAVVDTGAVVIVDLAGRSSTGPDGHVAWGPALGVPLPGPPGRGAVVVAARRAGRATFDPGCGQLVRAFADQVALALDTAARQRVARRLDVVADRERIARDLHDHVIQRLFAAGLSLQAALPRVADDQVRVRLSRVVEQLDETVRDIRTTIYDLHDSRAVDPSAGLRRRLREVVTETAGDVLRTAVRTSGAVDSLVTGPLAADVLAVVREGVSNSARHAAARHVTVTVEVTEEVVVEVRDDGRGIDPAVARSGLRNAADRAERRGGSCVAVPLPDGGTALRWRVPLPVPTG
ncbi:GAF domain-containing sensor histidine kinase [Klenkia terrae]|uniref:GAF domain-containing protein n=1 Tax=Klenkia terrae TaxID=1052259 RepID=A0ABU8EB39_9ACTN|nr:GAF domain-containing protein [Klenkia terrae]